jgi:hypothetical protein
MAFEQKLAAVPAQPFTSDGTALGVVTIADTTGFYIKQLINLQSTSQPQILLQVKNVLSNTQLIVGPNNNSLKASPNNYTNITTFTVAQGSTISAPEQNNFPIPNDDHYNTVFMPAPLMADRVVPVDPHGNFYNDNNPLPVAFDGTISIGDVTVVGTAPNHYPLEPNPDGSINVIVENPTPNTTVVNTYNELTAVAGGATVTIVTYTVPTLKKAIFQRAAFSGENIAKYDLIINSASQDTARTMFGGDLTGEFNFETGNETGLTLSAGNTIAVQVYNVRSSSASFEARIQVLEIPT